MDGLTYLQLLVQKYDITDTSFVNFTRDEIVRSGLTKEFVIAFEEELITDDPLVALADIDKQFKKGR